MPPSLDSAVATDGPTTESRLGAPIVWLRRLRIGLLLGIGLCLAWRLIPRDVPFPQADWEHERQAAGLHRPELTGGFL